MAEYLSRRMNGLTVVYPHGMSAAEAYGYAKMMQDRYDSNLYGVCIHLRGNYVTVTANLKAAPTHRMERLSEWFIDALEGQFDFLKEDEDDY